MKDFERVLAKFRDLGRTGLSIQALSEVCKRPISVEDIKGSTKCSLGYCETVRAPVVFAGLYDEEYPRFAVREEAEARLLLEAYPWPQFKGLQDMMGQSTTGLANTTFRALRKAARGERKTRRTKAK